MAMQGDVRASGWARRGRRLLLGLGVLAAAGVAVLFLAAFALVSGHGGVLQVALIAVLALMAVVAAAVVALAWIVRRLWLRGAWLEALPLLVGLPWLSRVMWAVRVLWTGHAVWRLRNRVSATAPGPERVRRAGAERVRRAGAERVRRSGPHRGPQRHDQVAEVGSARLLRRLAGPLRTRYRGHPGN